MVRLSSWSSFLGSLTDLRGCCHLCVSERWFYRVHCSLWHVSSVCEYNKVIIWPCTTYWTNQIESVFPSVTSPCLFVTLLGISMHLSFSLSLSHEKAEAMLKWKRSKEKKTNVVSVKWRKIRKALHIIGQPRLRCIVSVPVFNFQFSNQSLVFAAWLWMNWPALGRNFVV